MSDACGQAEASTQNGTGLVDSRNADPPEQCSGEGSTKYDASGGNPQGVERSFTGHDCFPPRKRHFYV